MKAIVFTKYGSPDVLSLKEVQTPTPKDGEVLIKVRASSVTTGDVNVRGFVFVPVGLKFMARLMFGLNKPKINILGTEVSGEIEAVGKHVTEFKRGDPVFGIEGSQLGAYAEYVCRPAQGGLVLKPANLSYEEAAVLPFGAGTALHFLKNLAKIQRGQKILINGASGCVGSYAVQIAKVYDAHVIGVCSTPNVGLVKSLGADQVIDYTKEDFTQNGEIYDIIFDTVGKTRFAKCKGSLKPQGLYLASAGGLREMLQMAWTALRGGKRVICGIPAESKAELNALVQLVEAGQIRPLIDRCYPLEQTAEAHRYVDAGHKRGSVVLTVVWS
jgi:NADPH:quinone reductase-like Zn-dependent oxidoreductase